MSEFTQTTTEELPSAPAGLTNKLEALRVIEDELLALARPFVGAIPEVAVIIEQIQQLRADARAAQ